MTTKTKTQNRKTKMNQCETLYFNKDHHYLGKAWTMEDSSMSVIKESNRIGNDWHYAIQVQRNEEVIYRRY